MKILITGDRNWTDRLTIANVLKHHIPFNPTIIQGGAKGADTIAKNIAESLDMVVVTIHANWNKYGKGAGPIRNTEMLNLNPTVAIAFHDDIKNSKGTKNMVNQCIKKHIPVTLFNSKGEGEQLAFVIK